MGFFVKYYKGLRPTTGRWFLLDYSLTIKFRKNLLKKKTIQMHIIIKKWPPQASNLTVDKIVIGDALVSF